MLPRISIITPSFNQARFLERTIRSILDQSYADLEYMVVDGGSTDGSVDLIRNYERQLTWWVSERDSGQAQAINKGLKRATGEIVGWLNSDDTLAPGALHSIAKAYLAHPQADLVYGHTCLIDEEDRVIRRLCAVRTNAYELIRFNRNMFSQPGTTWRRSLHDKIGYLDESLHYALDGDFWIRAAMHGVLYFYPKHLGNLRMYALTKSSSVPGKFEEEHRVLDARYGSRNLSPMARIALTLRRQARILSSPRTLAYRLGAGMGYTRV